MRQIQKKLPRQCVLGFILFYQLSGFDAGAQNLLTNGDFNLINSGTGPAGWSIWDYAKSAKNAWVYYSNDASSFDGSYYIAVGSSENGTSGAGLYQIIPGKAGLYYHLSVESAVQPWWWPKGEMRLFFLDVSNNILNESVGDVTARIMKYDAGLPWSNYTLTAKSPPGTAYVKVEFASQSGTGTVWFDNATLTSASSSTTLPPDTAGDSKLPELHTAEEIRRMPAEQAERRYPVRIQGIITFFDQRISTKAYRFIQDDTAGIYFYTDPEISGLALKPGQFVEIEGETGPGEFAPVLVAHKIQVLGEGKVLEAKPASFEALVSGQEDSQFVETEGIVHSVRLDAETSYYVLEVATGGGRISVYTSHIPTKNKEELVDSNVRIRGICITHFNQQRQLYDVGLMVPNQEDIMVEQTAPPAIPVQPIKNILQYKWGSTYGHRVKVVGSVTLCYADKMYIQDETEGLCVQTEQAGDFNVGDHVEILGFPAKGDFTPMLQNATCRKLSAVTLPQPEMIIVDEVLKGDHDCRLVSIEATLLDRAQQSNESFLILQAEKFVFHAYLKWPRQTMDFANLKNGSKVLVTGVCIVDPGNNWYSGPDWRAQSFSILPRSFNDIKILARPPWWNLQKMLVAVGILCASILTIMGWVFLLRRRVHAQTKIIEEKLQAEAAIKARYVELFENANDVVFTHDLQGRMTSINKAGALLLQRKQEDIIGKNFIDLIVEEQRTVARQWLEQVVSGIELPTADWDFLSAFGQRLKLEINSRRIEQAGQFIEVEGIARDATERKRLEREILEVANKEQRRLGHDLHDGVCQQLAAIAYRAHILARRLKAKGGDDSSEAQDIGNLINESLIQTRSVARGLFPVRLEADGLVSALEEFTASTSNLFQIKCNFSSSGTIPALNNTLAMHIYYITQEAVINAAKHSQTSQVTVHLKQTEDGILLTVQDDGIGFRPSDFGQVGMGIGIMRYRAKVIGATLELKSEPGQGTKIICKIRPMLE